MSTFGGFGQRLPDLSQVSAMPGVNMGQLGTSMAGMNVLSDYALSPVSSPNIGGILGALGAMGGNQQAPMMPPAPAPQLQAGGGQFMSPYQMQQGYQLRPTTQALYGLLGGAYGTF